MNNNIIRAKHYKVRIIKHKDSPIKFVVGVISYAIFIWLLLLGITLLVYVGNNKLKEMKGDTSTPKYNAYVVLTGSMLPQIQIKDVVITKEVPAQELEKGDVITFASSDSRLLGIIVTHRIVDKYYDSNTQKYTFKTKGDNNNVADMALAEESNIIGKVIFKIPKLGYIQDLLASKGGWIVAVILPCLAILSYDIMKIIRKIINKVKGNGEE